MLRKNKYLLNYIKAILSDIVFTYSGLIGVILSILGMIWNEYSIYSRVISVVAFGAAILVAPYRVYKQSQQEKEKLRSIFNVLKLEICNTNSICAEKYALLDGTTKFRCRATYEDGFVDENFNAYWTCSAYGDFSSVWNIFGKKPLNTVSIHKSDIHEKYYGLTCWLFPPEKDRDIEGNKNMSISFIY